MAKTLFNARLSDTQLSSQINRPWTIDRIIRNSTWWDRNAAYQRDQCWTLRMEQELIRSILVNIPIGAIHIVKKQSPKTKETAFCSILDGKQRQSAILRFANGSFKVIWRGSSFGWDEMQQDKNKAYCNNFLNYETPVVEWEPMKLLKQKILFEIINQYEKLNQHERLYCPHFFAKALFNYIYNDVFIDIAQLSRREIKKNIRFSGITWVHKMCILMYGEYLNDDFAVRETNLKTLKKSAKYHDEEVMKHFENKVNDINEFRQELIDEEAIIEMSQDSKYDDLYSKIEKLKSTVNAILYAINFKNSKIKNKALNSVDIMDLVVFTHNECSNNRLTPAYIKEHANKFHDFIVDYIQAKINNQLNAHTTNKPVIQERHDLFMKKIKLFEIDLTIKNKKATNQDIAIAMLTAPTNCPITGEELRDDNIAIDHVNPKSLSGETKFKAVSEEGNRKKSNLTINNLDKQKTYIKENE